MIEELLSQGRVETYESMRQKEKLKVLIIHIIFTVISLNLPSPKSEFFIANAGFKTCSLVGLPSPSSYGFFCVEIYSPPLSLSHVHKVQLGFQTCLAAVR